MLEKFVASSGREVRAGREDGSLVFGKVNGYLDRDSAFDAEEYFQAKRDAELDRWRDPIEPNYVVYLVGIDRVVVFREHSGSLETFRREEVKELSGFIPKAVAHRYFEAHPESKPWEDAKPGEVWAITVGGVEQGARVASDGRLIYLRGGMPFPMSITEGRRIWPEPERTTAEGVSSQAGLASFRGVL